MTNDGWGNGWLMLLGAFPQTLTTEVAAMRGKLYREKLDDLSDEQWLVAVNRAIDGGDFFPTIKALREAAQPERTAVVVKASNVTKAQEIYETIVDLYERGQHLGPRNVSERWGRAAMDAFAAAGGDAAFAWCESRNEVFRRKAFIESFSEVATADPKALVPMLPPSIEDAFALKPGEAKQLAEVVPSTLGNKRIEGPTPPPRLGPKPTKTIVPPPKEETTKEMLERIREMEKNATPIRSTDERLAELKAQADIIKGLPGK